MTVTVTQLGARRHYAVPRALAVRGMLERFHTDLYSGGGGMFHRVASGFPMAGMKRWAARQDSGLSADVVESYPFFGLQYKMWARRSQSQSELTRTWIEGGEKFCRLVVARGWGNADTVYAFTSAARELFEAAKVSGVRCVLDHASAPKTDEDGLVRDATSRYPDWYAAPGSDRYAEAYTDRQREEWKLADVIVCGSSFVKESIRRLGGPVEKTVVVPLGLRMPITVNDRSETKTGLNVLFVGDDGVRKGLGDFVTAIRLAGSEVRGRVVGNVKLSDRGTREVGAVVDLVGSVPRSEMAEQYRWADVFVLPSYSDTFGLVILEAMSHGVPVITTPNTGGPDVLRDGVDGLIVPVGDPEAIADLLIELQADPDRLNAMSRSAFERSSTFDLDSYSTRLVDALDGSVRAAS